MTQYITVVYAIDDEAAFTDHCQIILDKFKDMRNEGGWTVSAVSVDDEITRVELIEEANERCDQYVIQWILDHQFIGQFRSLDEFLDADEA